MKLYHTRRIIAILILLLISLMRVYGQSTAYNKFIDNYKEGNFTDVYNQMIHQKSDSPELILLKALSFHNLPDKHSRKKEVEDEYLYPLQTIQQTKDIATELKVNNETFFMSELRKLQENIFLFAKKLYGMGIKKRAATYFDELHKTFDNSSPVLKNVYGFNDSYFQHTLRKEIDILEEFEDEFYERYDLLQDFYFSNNQFKEWNNPIYRLANTAKDEQYLTEDEKMVFYFLNLARMNPKLFRETFVHAKLHIKFHGDLALEIPVYDTLDISSYPGKLTFREFFSLPVHRMYDETLAASTLKQFVQKKVIRETKRGKRFRYDIRYREFYDFLNSNKPDLLVLKNLPGYNKTKNGTEFLLFKLYDKKYSIYRKSYKEETEYNYYYQSLFEHLLNMKPHSILYPDYELFKTAECWALEAGKRGLKGHDRIHCSKDYHAESCDYGNKNGFDVVLSLLVDKFVPDLGHRKTLLGGYRKMGVAIRPHKSDFHYNAVLDFFR